MSGRSARSRLPDPGINLTPALLVAAWLLLAIVLGGIRPGFGGRQSYRRISLRKRSG